MQVQDIAFENRVVRTFIIRRQKLLNAALLLQYRIWGVLGGKVSSHVVIMQPSAVLERFKNTLCVS